MTGCEDCAKVAGFWEGQSSGQHIEHEGTKAYIAKAKSSDKAVLFVPDIFGLDLPNNLLLADKYAEKGYTTVIPDYFADHPVPVGALKSGDRATFLAWQQALGPQIYVPLTEKFLKYLEGTGAKSIGIVGYCWGGRPAVLLAATDKVKALVVNHGSFLTDEDVEGIKQPALFNGSDNDPHISKERLETFRQIVEENEVPEDFKFFPGAGHGWTCKGDEGDKELAAKIEDAFDRGIAWFKKYV